LDDHRESVIGAFERGFIAETDVDHAVRANLPNLRRPLDGTAGRHPPWSRDECLNAEIFENLDDAKRKIAAWRRDYNGRRPHSAWQPLSEGVPPRGILRPHRKKQIS
jgi:hypothetical protein